ncbi:MAG: hypothetical protein OXF31_11545 [Gammaproteobacteria bacterium]|nr:hypothetical protein [Gammaproteobacteria bacterium]
MEDMIGFVALGALLFGLFAWLKGDIAKVRDDVAALRDRISRLEGVMDTLRESLFEKAQTPR